MATEMLEVVTAVVVLASVTIVFGVDVVWVCFLCGG